MFMCHICVYACVAFHTHDILCTIGYIIYIYILYKCMICDAIGDLRYVYIYGVGQAREVKC